MHSIQLKDFALAIAHKIFKEDFCDIEECMMYMFKRVDIIGESNKHLRNPLNLDKNCFYFREREVPLNGSEVIYGDFILFEYSGHNEDMYIKEFESLELLEKEIKGDGGFTNPFMTYQAAMIRGKLEEYSLYFTNKNDGEDYKFEKDYHDLFECDAKQRGIPYYNITDVRLKWER